MKVDCITVCDSHMRGNLRTPLRARDGFVPLQCAQPAAERQHFSRDKRAYICRVTSVRTCLQEVRHPLDAFQANQLQQVFSILGPPDPVRWPDIVHMQHWSNNTDNIRANSENHTCQLEAHLKKHNPLLQGDAATAAEMDLMLRCATLKMHATSLAHCRVCACERIQGCCVGAAATHHMHAPLGTIRYQAYRFRYSSCDAGLNLRRHARHWPNSAGASACGGLVGLSLFPLVLMFAVSQVGTRSATSEVSQCS